MNFAYIDKNEFEADVITNILSSENIYFKTIANEKYLPMFMGVCCLKNYDIKFNTGLEKYLFIDKLVQEKLNKYQKLEKCFNLPCYDKYRIIEPKTSLQKNKEKLSWYIKIIMEQEKPTSLLYKLAKWVKQKWEL